MVNFEQLRVYQQALEYIDGTYLITRNWPRDETFGLTSQLRRASVSIALNIAEGSSRTKKDFRHFLDLSRGSCYECIAILDIGMRQKLLDEKEHKVLYKHAIDLAKMLSALKTSLH